MAEPLLLNTITYNTDGKLKELLVKLGFVSEPCNSSDLLRLPSDAKPSCHIYAQSNHLEWDVVVSSKDDSFHIYSYEPNDDMFALWDTLSGQVTDTALRETILIASSTKALSERWEDEVKATLVLGAIAQKLGQFVEMHNLGWLWQGWMRIKTPAQAYSVNTVFIAKERLSHQPINDILEVSPDLIVDVIRPTSKLQREYMTEAITVFFKMGVSQIWIASPTDQCLWVHLPEKEPYCLHRHETLVGDGLFTGFVLSISEIMDIKPYNARSYPLVRVSPRFP